MHLGNLTSKLDDCSRFFSIFVELDRFIKSESECKTDRDWLFYIFRHSSSLVGIPEGIRNKPYFKQLLEACRIAAFDEQKKTEYEKTMLDERDILEIKDYAFVRGEAKGRAEGKEETAKAMLKDGLPTDLVVKYSGLTEERIRDLKAETCPL